MSEQRVNLISGRALIVLSVIALLSVISGYFQAPQPDEGTAAHIFQISVVLVLPAILLFLLTADWEQRWRSLRPLLLSATALAVAFAALYYLEHVFYLEHYR